MTTEMAVSAPLGAAAIGAAAGRGMAFAATGAPGAPAVAGTAGAASSSRRNFTVGFASAVIGLAAETCTRAVSFFGFGASVGRPKMAVSFLASSSELVTGPGFAGGGAPPGGWILGVVPRPVNPGGKLMRTVSFFDSSGVLGGILSAMILEP